MLHPDFPVVEGRYQMTSDWAVTLPVAFNRRFEDDSLVFWRPGITAWTIVWQNNAGETQQERLEWLRSESSPAAFDIESITDGNVIRYSYQLTEGEHKKIVNALYCYVIGANGHVQMAVYFDNPSDLVTARAIVTSIEEIVAS